MDIYELLNGKPLTRANLCELQKDPRADCMNQKTYDVDFAICVENAGRTLSLHDDIRSLSVKKEDSIELNMAGDDEVTAGD